MREWLKKLQFRAFVEVVESSGVVVAEPKIFLIGGFDTRKRDKELGKKKLLFLIVFENSVLVFQQYVIK